MQFRRPLWSPSTMSSWKLVPHPMQMLPASREEEDEEEEREELEEAPAGRLVFLSADA